jgi:hypothetical protein
MTLRSLELLPRGDAGWTSGKLKFGRATTVALGPNGSGKTPLVKALLYALGHPVALPPLVQERCAAVSLEIEADDGDFTLERRLTESGVDASVRDAAGASTRFSDEKELSEWVLPRLGLPSRILTGNGGEQIPPYVSVAGPMFLVDQDTGWVAGYVPIRSFVRDQREEVIRWLLNLPQKHRPVDRSGFQEAKTALAAIQEQIKFKRRALEALKRELGEDRRRDATKVLEERRVEVEAQLQRAQSALETMSQAESALDVRLREAVQQRDELLRRLSNAKRRKTQLLEVQAEVGAELGALEQNEVASEAFRALCGNEACQFFRRPEESYGRRLLYLKDQLKDFESSTGETERELGILQSQLAGAEAAAAEASDVKRKSLEKAGGGAAINVMQAAGRELVDVNVRLDRLARLAKEQARLEVLIDREARAGEEVAALRPKGVRRDGERLAEARTKLAAAAKEWLLTLRTPNVQVDVAFDEEFHLVVDGERFLATASPSGSTRTRLVLAYHAALVETSLQMKGSHPRLLVLDAPRQHEMNAADLAAYIRRFHALSSKQDDPIQLVFSATDAEVVPQECVDELWQPTFETEEGRRYLGPRPKPPKPAPEA